MPRFDQSFNGLCEQNLQDTLQLKQRYLDAKSKQRVSGGPKKHQSEKQKQQQLLNANIQQQQQAEAPGAPQSHSATTGSSIQSSVHVQQKFLKRPAEELDPGGSSQAGNLGAQDGTNYEPPVKLQCTTQTGGHQSGEGGLTKFSVEIVQQLEFTTSAANSQPQQISTNVTVKAHTNTSVKSDIPSPKTTETTTTSSNQNSTQSNSTNNVKSDSSILVDCVKQEPDNDFADLDQCAAALEKDAAVTGKGFGVSNLMGEDTNDEMITPDALKELISDITNCPEFMKDFDFDDSKNELDSSNTSGILSSLKVEDLHQVASDSMDLKDTSSLLSSNLQNNANGSFNSSPNIFDSKTGRVPPYHPGMEFVKTEMSPAAQTLKQMAEQHQHKTQGGTPQGGFANNRGLNNSGNNPRSPYHSDFHSPFQGSSAGDYGSPGGPGFASPQIKNSPSFPSPHHQNSGESISIKQEQQQQMLFQQQSQNQQNDIDAAAKQRKNLYKQQYSPYGSPAGGHGSPGYLPQRPTPASNNNYGGGTPPRPPSGPGGGPNLNNQQGNQSGNNTSNLQINQAQQLHISQQQGGISVSAGQQLHLSGELKGNVSIATQQGMHFSQGQGNGPANNTSQNQNNPQAGNMGPQQGGMGPQQGGVPQQNPMHNPNMSQQGNMMGNTNNMMGPGGGVGMGLGSPAANSMSHHHHQGHGMPGMTTQQQHLQQQQQQMMNNQNQNVGGDGYSLTQSQTINFTQQTLRQRGVQNPNAGMSGMIGGVGPGNMAMAQSGTAGSIQGMAGQIRHMSPHMQPQQASTLMEQKLLHQQMLRQQQQNMMAQQQQQMIRPPPPDYKSSAAGLMQQQGAMGGPNQPRYTGAAGLPPNIRRMPHQPMPPSGPMMRPHNMYMMQQHQPQQGQQGMMVGGPLRGMYANRQPNPMGAGAGNGSLEQLSHTNSAEWRQLMMSQQQSGQFQQGGPGMRGGPQFQHTQSQGFGVTSVMSGGNGNVPGGNSIQQMTAMQQQQHLLRQQSAGNGMMGNVMGGGGNQGMGGMLGQQALMGGPSAMGGGPQGMGGPPNMSQVQSNSQMVQQQHLLLQQQQTLLQQQQQLNTNNGSQIAINSLHMQQNQTISMTASNQGGAMQQGQMHSNSNALNSAPFNPQSTDDFNLDFLANIPGSDAGAFSEQELLNSFDSDAGFNLDIL